MGKHVHGRPGSEREFLDDLLGRGKGDPDYWGNPAEKEASQPKVKKNITTPGLTNPTSITQQNKTSTGQKGKHS